MSGSSSKIDRKTAPKRTQSLPSTEKNVLNGYRSYNYNFVLAGLDKSALTDPTVENFESSIKLLTILSSSGKGNSVITPSRSTDSSGQTLIKNFNKQSPGRFDMFIDNVEITTLMAFQKQSTTTLPTTCRFEVFEPYSINGFVEALHVTAVAAGYVNYAEASFILKMSFVGYSDDSDMPEPDKSIDKSTRYFTIKITGFQIDISERGTRYSCVAIPYNDDGFVDVKNRLQQNIQIGGGTVSQILEKFMTELTDQRKQSAIQAREKAPPGFDEYKIEFRPSVDENTDISNAIKNSKFVEFGKDNQLFGYGDPQTTQYKNAYPGKGGTDARGRQNAAADPRAAASDIKDPHINFPANSNINECIDAVLSGSTWARSIIEEIKPDEYGMIYYFSVKLEITNKSEINDLENKPYQTYKYIVSPYRIHYTKVPNYNSQRFDFTKVANLRKLAFRTYDYLYTGQNVDVTSFKIHFDHTYYEALGRAMGNTSAIGSKDSVSQSNIVDVKQSPKTAEDLKTDKRSSVPTPPRKEGVKLLTADTIDTPTSAQSRSDDPYFLLSKAMYDAIINSNTGMIRGEIEIIGDPFYLATGGIGNYKPKSAGYGVTTDGSIDHNAGQVFIVINFKNPDDVGSFDEGGLVRFSDTRVSFSGVYMVTRVLSRFTNGLFRQRLQIIRMPQSDEPSSSSVSPAAVLKTVDNAINKRAVDTKPASTVKLG